MQQRVEEVRGYFAKRVEYEQPLCHAGVRQRQFGRVDNDLIEKNQVYIYRTVGIPPVRTFTDAPQFAFDALRYPQQFFG